MVEWHTPQLERPARGIDPPPEEVTAFLDAHAAELAAGREHLAGGPVPRWEMHVERLFEAPVPNLLGHVDLQKLLATDGLVRIRRGEHELAARDLEASWNLMLPLSDSPVLISQWITLADARMIVAWGATTRRKHSPSIERMKRSRSGY